MSENIIVDILFLSSYLLFSLRLERLKMMTSRKQRIMLKNIKLLYTTTLSVSSEKSPTWVQILPILTKLEAHFTVAEEDTLFTSALKEKV